MGRTALPRAGFTLVEMYVSLLCVVVALAICTDLLFSGRRHQAEALATTKAVFMAQTLLAEVEVTAPAARAGLPTSGQLPNTDRFAAAVKSFAWERAIQSTPEGTTRAVVAVRYQMPRDLEPRTLTFAREFHP
ncbi:hypothetical protein HS125_21140 [bacterium]|nr:hypothetical protein [bacterium]MBE7561313.1 hypothetical protein [bacterium]